MFFVQKREGGTEVEMHISEEKIKWKGEQENLIFRKKKRCQKRGTTDMDMKPSFHGALRENPNRKVISAPVMSCPAGESDVSCGMRGGWSSSLQNFWYNSGRVLDSLVQLVTYVGPGKQPCWAVEHAAECFHVSLPWANRKSSNSKLSLVWE